MIATKMDDCLWAGKPSKCITNTKVNLAFYPSGVGKSSSGLSDWGYGGGAINCQAAGNTVCSHMACDAP